MCPYVQTPLRKRLSVEMLDGPETWQTGTQLGWGPKELSGRVRGYLVLTWQAVPCRIGCFGRAQLGPPRGTPISQ